MRPWNQSKFCACMILEYILIVLGWEYLEVFQQILMRLMPKMIALTCLPKSLKFWALKSSATFHIFWALHLINKHICYSLYNNQYASLKTKVGYINILLSSNWFKVNFNTLIIQKHNPSGRRDLIIIHGASKCHLNFFGNENFSIQISTETVASP